MHLCVGRHVRVCTCVCIYAHVILHAICTNYGCIFLSLCRRYLRIRSYTIRKFDDPVPELPVLSVEHDKYNLPLQNLYEELPVTLPDVAQGYTYMSNPLAGEVAEGAEDKKEEVKENGKEKEEDDEEDVDPDYDRP